MVIIKPFFKLFNKKDKKYANKFRSLLFLKELLDFNPEMF